MKRKSKKEKQRSRAASIGGQALMAGLDKEEREALARKGAEGRAKSMTAEERSASAKAAAKARWAKRKKSGNITE